MENKKNLAGKRFGRLVAVADSGKRIHHSIGWACHCDCGKIVIVQSRNLLSGTTKSCGCLQKEMAKKKFTKHNGSYTRLYHTWGNIKTRCLNPHNRDYRYYGGHGITVCEEWKNDFVKFRDWALTHGYKKGLTIDRINNNGNYSPQNCQWVTRSENAKKGNKQKGFIFKIIKIKNK